MKRIRHRLTYMIISFKRNKVSYLLLIPLILFLILIMWYPFMRGIWISFHEWIFMGGHSWVGLRNYTWFLNSQFFYTSLIATLVYASGVILQLVFALAAAIVINQPFIKLKGLWHGLFILPYTMPPVVTGAIWLFLLDPNLGMVMQYLQKFGIIDKPIYWMVEPWPAKVVITWTLSWTFWPFMFIIILAALQSIPKTHYEISEIYGASWWQNLTRVVLPQIKNSILIALVIRLVWNLSKVSQVFELTGGGPGYETSIFGVLMYRLAYYSRAFGKSYTVGIFLLILTLLMIGPFIRRIQIAFAESR